MDLLSDPRIHLECLVIVLGGTTHLTDCLTQYIPFEEDEGRLHVMEHMRKDSRLLLVDIDVDCRKERWLEMMNGSGGIWERAVKYTAELRTFWTLNEEEAKSQISEIHP